MSDTTVKLCSVAFGDAFLGEHRWSDNWSASESDGKSEALVHATNIILRFCSFVDSDGVDVTYAPTSETDELIPDWLRQACCYEALYFLDLDNDPSRPFPLGILGLIKSGTELFDHEYEPPLFSVMCRRVLESNGASVDDPNAGGTDWGHKHFL